jgi:hypothetical protein
MDEAADRNKSRGGADAAQTHRKTLPCPSTSFSHGRLSFKHNSVCVLVVGRLSLLPQTSLQGRVDASHFSFKSKSESRKLNFIIHCSPLALLLSSNWSPPGEDGQSFLIRQQWQVATQQVPLVCVK